MRVVLSFKGMSEPPLTERELYSALQVLVEEVRPEEVERFLMNYLAFTIQPFKITVIGGFDDELEGLYPMIEVFMRYTREGATCQALLEDGTLGDYLLEDTIKERRPSRP